MSAGRWQVGWRLAWPHWGGLSSASCGLIIYQEIPCFLHSSDSSTKRSGACKASWGLGLKLAHCYILPDSVKQSKMQGQSSFKGWKFVSCSLHSFLNVDIPRNFSSNPFHFASPTSSLFTGWQNLPYILVTSKSAISKLWETSLWPVVIWPTSLEWYIYMF